jgi:hypothetical protein
MLSIELQARYQNEMKKICGALGFRFSMPRLSLVYSSPIS